MKYTITHTCGHTEVMNLVGPTGDRNRKIAYYESKPCFECETAERTEAAKETAQELGFPALEGTPKQIEWAERLRAFAVKDLVNPNWSHAQNTLRGTGEMWAQIDPVVDENYEWVRQRDEHAVDVLSLPEVREAFQALVYEWAGEADIASWWINNRGELTETFYRECRDRLWAIVKAAVGGEDILAAEEAERRARQERERLEAERQAQEKAASAAAKTEATVLAEGAVSALVAEIAVQDKAVSVSYPEKNERLRAIARDMKFEWDGSHWQAVTGFPADVAAQIGHRLLGAKINIRIFDEELRRRAVAGEFKVANHRVIAARTAAPYEGWLTIRWDREKGDYYESAMRIHGAVYARELKRVVVPPESWTEVQDFARIKGFDWTGGAEAIAARQRELMESALRVDVAPPDPEPFVRDRAAIPTLETPEKIDVPDSLRDE